MANKTMHHQIIGDDTYEIVDQSARQDLTQNQTALTSIASGGTGYLDSTISDWTSGRFDHGYQESDSGAVYTTNKITRGEVTNIVFDDSKYWLVFGLWYKDGTYKGNYGFITTSPVVPFATVSDTTVTLCTVGIKTKNGSAIDASDVKNTTIFTTAVNNKVKSVWNNKDVLVIGDSLTANGIWASKLTENLGMNVTLHSKGGLNIVKLVDGENGISGDYSDTSLLQPLSVAEVTDKDLIIFYAGYNDRGKEDGEIGDVYDPDDQSGNTIAGIVQYAINRIYETLSSANNLTCRVVVVTPHCAGKYQYINVDGYGEYPSGTGRTMLTMANTIEEVANYNAIPCLNLWKNSGINKETWTVFAYSSTATNSSGTGDYPYPYNNDQLHLNDSVGYPYLGERIVDWIKTV